MTTSTTEEQETARATPTGETPKPNRNRSVAARSRLVAPARHKSVKKARPKKSAPKSAKKFTPTRDGIKSAKILDLLRRADGATLKELMKATAWLPHSVRGFLSGVISKKMGLAVTSIKGDDGERSYSVKT